MTIIASSTAFGQTLKRQDGETGEMFANRSKPDSTELAHTVFETALLDTTKKVILAFYKKTIYEARQMDTYVDHSEYDIILGYLFVPTGDNNYDRKLIDTIPNNGGDPEILSVFLQMLTMTRTKS
ncbi:hypothetical protein V9K67_05855 [Paraflavisolibacter sp. H34]|uniref:hypothetical protein n=1 Tax=Huijunlia imazamoxiresistens TaxID=3127457 RepID=UPI0030191C50